MITDLQTEDEVAGVKVLINSASSGNGCSETSVWFCVVRDKLVCGLMAAAASQKMQPDEMMVKMRRRLLLS